MLISRANIALNAVICMIYFIFTLIMELWLLRNVGFYRSFLQSYVLSNTISVVYFLRNPLVYREIFTDDYYPSGYFRRTGTMGW